MKKNQQENLHAFENVCWEIIEIEKRHHADNEEKIKKIYHQSM